MQLITINIFSDFVNNKIYAFSFCLGFLDRWFVVIFYQFMLYLDICAIIWSNTIFFFMCRYDYWIVTSSTLHTNGCALSKLSFTYWEIYKFDKVRVMDWRIVHWIHQKEVTCISYICCKCASKFIVPKHAYFTYVVSFKFF